MVGSRRAVLGVATLLCAALLACDALLGLGDYGKTSCADVSGESCTDSGEGGYDVKVRDAADASADGDAEADADADADADAPTTVNDAANDGPTPHQIWAHWPMPNPDASIAPDLPDAAELPNQMAYDAGPDGSTTVFDEVTGLTWERSGDAGAGSIDEARAHCATLTLGNGWRLPTRIELVSIVDFTASPAINSTAFPGTHPQEYWTSSAVPSDAGTQQYWTVSFANGLVDNTSGSAQYVRCVQSP